MSQTVLDLQGLVGVVSWRACSLCTWKCGKIMKTLWFTPLFTVSGVAKLGHTRARAIATGGCAPPVQALLKIIGSECTVINRELGAKSVQRC